jgi:hypothetical protein
MGNCNANVFFPAQHHFFIATFQQLVVTLRLTGVDRWARKPVS